MTATAEAVATERFRLVASGLDVEPLLEALNANRDLWGEYDFRQAYPGSPHRDTETIFLRMPRVVTPKTIFCDLDAVEWPALDRLPEARDLVRQVIGRIFPDAEPFDVHGLGRVMIVSLLPGGSIEPHADEGAYAEHYDRFHLSLFSKEGNAFYCGNDKVHMRPGELWWFNHRQPHCVDNDSDAPRVHLIVDVVAPEYRKLRGLGLTFQREKLTPALAFDMGPLLKAHAGEIAHYGDIPLSVDWNAYFGMQDEGRLRVYTVRLNGSLIGYSVHFVGPNMHYASSLQAREDVLFVHPEHRKSGVGVRLIRFADDSLRAEGVQVSYRHVKERHNFGPLLERLGYESIDLIFGRRLDKQPVREA